MKIGVIGVGVVGSALMKVSQEAGLEVHGYDINKEEFFGPDKMAAVVGCDLVFISVPTLTSENGLQDIGPLMDVTSWLSSAGFKGAVVNKCTCLPGTTNRINETTKLAIGHSPEFLTEANPLGGIKSEPTIIGTESSIVIEAMSKWAATVKPESQFLTLPNPTESELVKYLHNCYLSVKIMLCNEFFQACLEKGASYVRVRAATVLAGGLGDKHTMVPGPDARLGYGGMCFPKDTLAWARYSVHERLPVGIVGAAWEMNKNLRKSESGLPGGDWKGIMPSPKQEKFNPERDAKS